MKKNKINNDNFWEIFKKIQNVSRSRGYPNITMEVAFLLANILLQKKPTSILEIGTCNGISTMVLAHFSDAKIISIEKNNLLLNEINVNLKNYTDRVEIILDDALMYLNQCKIKFDFVFIDAMKRQYVDYLDLLIKNNLLFDNCILIFDNVIRLKDKMKNFYQYLNNHKIKYDIIKTTDDGIMIIKDPFSRVL